MIALSFSIDRPDQDATWYGVIGLGPGDIALDEDQAPPWKGAQQPPPHFSAHVYCGQTAGWIRIALATEVGLGPGDILTDRDPAHPHGNGHQPPPTFRPIALARLTISATAELLLSWRRSKTHLNTKPLQPEVGLPSKSELSYRISENFTGHSGRRWGCRALDLHA